MNQVEVAVPTPLARTFTYSCDREIAPGTRVLVPFGKRKLVGVALGPPPPRPATPAEEEAAPELKAVESVIDDAPVYSPAILEIGRWLAGYYLHPIGEVLRTMLPAGSSKVVKQDYVLTDRARDLMAAGIAPEATLLAALFGKKKTSLGSVTLKAKLRKIDGAPSIKDMIDRGLIGISRGTRVKARTSAEPEAVAADAYLDDLPPGGAPPPPELRPAQQAAFEAVVAEGLAVPKPKHVFLLHGVTGSGKTEVYLHLIAEAIRRDPAAQALVLVPEISLTPQMTRVFARRFPDLVAVVHSAMTDPDRWAQLDRVRRGEAKILIGPRSAVFGPFQRLALILVDEEHDSSYKQSTGLTYNGRDIAVLRGKLEGAPVVLGSATPSMESYNNALTGRYRLLEMRDRVTGRPLPEIELVPSDPAARRQGAVVGVRGAQGDEDAEIPISPVIVDALRANLAEGRQAIVLVNRRGYAYYLLSLEDKKPVQCPHCSISLTLHARSTVLRCHYCDYGTTLDRVTRERPDETFVAVGYGSQKAEDCLRGKLPGARVVRLDSDTVVKRELLPETLGKFRRGEIDVLVGTQILAKGHDFPNVTLIVILEVDQILGLPDFRAGERTFQLVVQAAGRAGRAEHAGKVLIQTLRASHPVVAAAITQDYRSFAERELRFRQALAYPPFSRMIAIELNSPEQPRLVQLCQRIESWVEQMAALKPDLVQRVRMLGPSVPPIERVRGRYRRTVIFSADAVEPLRALVGNFLAAFQKLQGDVRMRIDVDPQSLI